MVDRFTGSGRLKEGGYLGTHKQDFNAHRTGGDWRHAADHIDMNPALTLYPSPDVQGTLELLAGAAASIGSGFVSVGNAGTDGYAVGSYNVGTSVTPTFRDALLAAFSDDRLQNGGIVFVLPGTYTLITTVDVPAGISIMGEISSSIVIGEMSEEPMFRFLRSTDYPTIGGDTGSGDIPVETGSPIDESRLFNIILADNLDGYAGVTGHSDSTMKTVPMVEIETASRVHIENVKFIGRIDNGPVATRGKTLRAIGYTAGGTTGSHLTVRRCFFDGMQTGIDFGPGNGDIDHLTIDHCRARVFGEEGTFVVLRDNCFATMTLCNFTATSNYVIGYGAEPDHFVFTCFMIRAGATGGTDVNILVTGTTGKPSSGATVDTVKTVFYDETINSAPGLSYKAVVTSNNWAGDIDSTWHVVVGEAITVASTFGDFNGPGAIDLLLSANFEYPTTVFVGNGTYDVTVESTDASRYNFIGIAGTTGGTAARRPIFDMDLGPGATTDELGNRTFTTGGEIDNIRFRSSSGTQFHSIRPDVETKAIIKNCKFENCTLSVAEDAKRIKIINCEFLQDNTFSDNLGLLAPRAEYVLVEGCRFTGNGYVGLIGTDIGLGYSTAAQSETSTIIVRDCVMDLTGYTIDDASIMTNPGYFTIDTGFVFGAKGRVEVSGCHIVADSDLTQQISAIGAGAIVTMYAFFQIRSRDIYIDNCVVNSPTQLKSGAPFAGAQFSPDRSMRVTNSKFYNGGPPCQVTGGGNIGVYGALADGVVIDNCFFMATDGPNTITLLDIDLDPGVKPDTAKIVVSNCNFSQQFDADDYAVNHFDVTGSTAYFTQGIAQIYAFEFRVDFHNNTIFGTIPAVLPTISTNERGYGLAISNHLDTSGNLGDIIVPVNVHDNELEVISSHPVGASGDRVGALYVSASLFDIHDNNVRMNNTAVPVAGKALCAAVKTLATQSANTPPDSMIHNNVFSRRTLAGVPQNITNYVYIIPGTQPGRLVENIFDEPTVDGTLTTLVSDPGGTWTIERNKNQTVIASLKGSFGNHTLDNVAAGGHGGAATSSIDFFDNPALQIVDNSYPGSDNGNTRDFKWHIPAWQILPDNVEILEIALDYDLQLNIPAVTNDLYIKIFYDFATSEVSPVTNPTLVPATKTYTPTATFINTAVDTPSIVIAWTCRENAAGSLALEYDDLRITYRW